MATEMVKGRTIEEALELTNKDVAEALGGLPPEKVHCSLLAEEGIHAAVEDHRRRRDGLPPLPPSHDAVCHHGLPGEETPGA